MNNKTIAIIVLVLVLVLGAVAYSQMGTNKTDIDINYNDPFTTDDKDNSPDAGNVSEKRDLIILDQPSPNEIVKSPLTIKGKARGNWFFEASFPVKILGPNGEVLASHYATAQGEWMTENFVPFQSAITFTPPSGGGTGTLVLERDNPSGLPENDDSLRIPIRFAAASNPANGSSDETSSVKVYFSKNSPTDCSVVTAVTRTIAKTEAVARVSIEELLEGPTSTERSQGFSSSIPAGVKIQKLEVKNGTAYVDFSDELDNNVAGSCRVTAIRAQIENTLKQFSTIKNVVISIDGRTNDILQP